MQKKESEFCSICENKLIPDIVKDELNFKCYACNLEYNSTPEDSLRFEEIKGDPLSKFITILKNTHKDPVNPKLRITCPKCKYGFAKQIRIGDDMKLITSCCACGYKWLYN